MPADGVVADIPLWTPITRVTLAIEIAWIVASLALLLWLTRPAKSNRSRPEAPLRQRTRRGEDDVPPMAA
jgi:hypothetical protein